MAFFPRSFYQPSAQTESASFTPLFRLLEDFDTYSRGSESSSRRSVTPTWLPKFDIRETGEAFQLHGELPGMNKENVHIEFTEPQTMIIRGRSERNYTAGTPPQEATQAIESSEGAPKSPTNSHQATVQDDDEDQTGSGTVTKKSEEKQVSKKPADKAKYWLSERSIGEFTRTFNFPSRVDQENVTANFADGILNVVVPKAKKHEARRITIQ